jgi:alkanesulfonate monooxygenase SsuD/methylene tetrahydromethanopterin reductase-like flavin-dependent oxidoreductase (luciferase family)
VYRAAAAAQAPGRAAQGDSDVEAAVLLADVARRRKRRWLPQDFWNHPTVPRLPLPASGPSSTISRPAQAVASLPGQEGEMPALGFGVHLISRGAGDPATAPFPSHRVMAEDGVRVERLGFDSVWLPDHFYFERASGIETFPEVWTLLTAIAVKTERLTLGTNVLAATFRHPALLAKMAGAVQELAGGRFVLGIGAGNQAHEHAAFGLDFEHRIGRFKEYLPIMTDLLNGRTVTVEGRYFTLREASLRTVVPPVPVWVAAGGPQMFALAARYASGWNMAGGGTDLAAIRGKYDQFAAACRAAGRAVKDFDVCKMTFTAIAADAAGARAMAEELAAKGRVTPAALAARTVVGTPDEIAAHLRALTGIGVNHHIFSIAESAQWPDYWEAVEFVRREVVPRVRA